MAKITGKRVVQDKYTARVTVFVCGVCVRAGGGHNYMYYSCTCTCT